MTEKKVTEAEKAELRDMLGKATAPCPFKVGDIVTLVPQWDDEEGPYRVGPKAGRTCIVLKVRVPDAKDDGTYWFRFGGTENMSVLYKKVDAETGEATWRTWAVESWRFRLA